MSKIERRYDLIITVSRSFKFIAGCLLLILAWILLAWFLAENLIVKQPLDRADAILVLSGSRFYPERTAEAALVYSKGVAPKIFLTDDGGRAGWSKSEQRNPRFVELIKQKLIEGGVPADAVEILPPQVSGTIDEAEVLRERVSQGDINSVLLVTSPYHTRRSLNTFEKVLKDKNVRLGIVSPPPGEQSPPPFTWWFSKKGWNSVAAEYVKIIYYRLNY